MFYNKTVSPTSIAGKGDKNVLLLLDIRGSVHHSLIHIKDPTVYQNFISYLYEAQHVSGDTAPIIRSLKLH